MIFVKAILIGIVTGFVLPVYDFDSNTISIANAIVLAVLTAIAALPNKSY